MCSVLIVDDELEIRKGLSTAVPWEQWGVQHVYSADDGNTALEIFDRDPVDLLITDIKMPNVTGIELVEKLYLERQYEGKVIVISGYDEFQYAKKVLTLGVADYLLKPINLDEFENVVRKTLEQIRQERLRKKNQSLMNENLSRAIPKMREEVLRNLIERPYSIGVEAQIAHRLKGLDLEWMLEGNMAQMVVEVDNLKSIIQDKPPNEKDLILFAIGNVMQQALEEQLGNRSVLFRSRLDQWIALVQVEGNQMEEVELLESFSTKLFVWIKEYVKVPVSISITPIGTIEQIFAMYGEAKESLKYKKLYGNVKKLVVDERRIKEIRGKENILLNPDEFIELLKQGSEQEVHEAMATFPNLVKEWGIKDAKGLQQSAFKWLVDVFRSAKKAGWNETGWEKNIISVWEQIEQFDTLESIQGHVAHQIAKVMGGMHEQFGSQNQIIFEAEQFIIKHFSDNITLQIVADQVHVTSAWLSKLFRNETGSTFLEYLTDFRLRKACELLEDLNLKVYQVSDQVGYQDVVYFSKLFKKKYGYSPREYRNLRGNHVD